MDGFEKTVLVIDDEDFISSLIARTLKREGFNVLVANDYMASLKLIDSTPLDIVVSDVMLPGGSGKDIVEHIRNHPKLQHIPVILVTGLDAAVLEEQKIRANAFVTKPFDLRQLSGMVKSLLNLTPAGNNASA